VIKLNKDAINRRVRLLQSENWAAAVRPGNKGGIVKGWQEGTLKYNSYNGMYHVIFDNQPSWREGFIYGIGGEGHESGLFDFID